ncbi:hypothetical protein L195_g061141, partial [Trifolium pratense]
MGEWVGDSLAGLSMITTSASEGDLCSEVGSGDLCSEVGSGDLLREGCLVGEACSVVGISGWGSDDGMS